MQGEKSPYFSAKFVVFITPYETAKIPLTSQTAWRLVPIAVDGLRYRGTAGRDSTDASSSPLFKKC